MDRVISDKIRTARKEYKCDACHFWQKSGITLDECETLEQMIIAETAIKDGFKILAGQKYRDVKGIQDGQIVTYKARIDMDDVCNDLDLFPEN